MSKIMVVDDEKNVVELLSFIFTKQGHQVIEANNGTEALEKVGILPPPTLAGAVIPDVMILDIMMPGIDGYTVQTKMLENESTKNVPIVILTAKGQMKDLFGMAANVAAYIEKPFDPKILQEKVNEILRK